MYAKISHLHPRAVCAQEIISDKKEGLDDSQTITLILKISMINQ